ncbi:unnamed protein product [Cuscuta epithymum]|uniref:Reverse transcriptase Ty1/copia-type domain-containing protein n=1 Tax=Cuscuta epithymum TaxID=186058 RepID=A0AAV0D7P7_9ASTE|nr:unnamed protein product [Cuscuta epithymum]
MTDPSMYRRALGLLQYLAFTLPDISFGVNRLSQYMHCPTLDHWQAVKRVLRYLKGTIHQGLFLRRDPRLTLTAFSDSDWGGVRDGGRFTTAYILYLGSNVISWKSAKQKCVYRSSTEAEYRVIRFLQTLLGPLHTRCRFVYSYGSFTLDVCTDLKFWLDYMISSLQFALSVTMTT